MFRKRSYFFKNILKVYYCEFLALLKVCVHLAMWMCCVRESTKGSPIYCLLQGIIYNLLIVIKCDSHEVIISKAETNMQLFFVLC